MQAKLMTAFDNYDRCENAKIDAIISVDIERNTNPMILNDHYFWEFMFRSKKLSEVQYISDSWRDVRTPIDASITFVYGGRMHYNPEYWIYEFDGVNMTLTSAGLIKSNVADEHLKCLSIANTSIERNGSLKLILSNFKQHSTLRHKFMYGVKTINSRRVYSSDWDKFEVDLPNDTLFENDCTALSFRSMHKYWKADTKYLSFRDGNRVKKYRIGHDLYRCTDPGLNKSTLFVFCLLTMTALLIWAIGLILPYITLYRENIVEIDDFQTRMSLKFVIIRNVIPTEIWLIVKSVVDVDFNLQMII
ncbi:hypothetical protein B4U80_13803 [Leptotrombidium deliense]|uniref:Uncharacterized protein n=1 Tax=Leptotrombidium deliense TaxID=299467 RepID=A0A443SDH7_9ACAR|nr:hypothetical protein B4U80_13803 [Leptotrombidium deliense]